MWFRLLVRIKSINIWHFTVIFLVRHFLLLLELIFSSVLFSGRLDRWKLCFPSRFGFKVLRFGIILCSQFTEIVLLKNYILLQNNSSEESNSFLSFEALLDIM